MEHSLNMEEDEEEHIELQSKLPMPKFSRRPIVYK